MRRVACVATLLTSPPLAGAETSVLDLAGQATSQTYPHVTRIEQVVALERFGRYAFEATGDQPVRVQLVDHMAGPGPVRQGRADRFLDRGRVKVVLHGQFNGTGDIRLTARPFNEQHGEKLPQLPEQRLVETRLRDYQRRSYWIEVKQPRWISVEAGGRYLADLRLWRDGRWLVAAEPDRELLSPVSGQPLAVRRIHARLEPGLYRLSAYGGPGNPWSTDSDAAPLYLRMGVPELLAEGWSVLQASPFGVDRWRLRTTANVYHLGLPEAEPATLTVSPLSDNGSPYLASEAHQGEIDKDARDPETTVRTGNTGNDRPREMLVTVHRAPGAEYRLAYLRHARRYDLPRSPSAWVSTVALGDPRDAIDATAIIVHDPPGRGPTVKASRAVPLSSSKAWRRRFNLLEPVDLLVEVEEDGTYVAAVGEDSGANVEFQVEPLDRTAARNFRTRWDVTAEARWDLVEGFYRIAMRPRHGDAGIAEVSLHHAAASPDSLAGPELAPRQASAVFEGVALSRYDYVLANRYNYGRSGLTVRSWPLALNRPLPVTQSAGTTQRFSVRGGRGRTLIAQTPAGKRLPLSTAASGPTRESLEVPNQADVFVRNDSQTPVRYLLRWVPEPSPPLSPLDALTAQEVDRRLPDFPAIQPDRTERLDLSRREQATYRLSVSEPALYRLESTGLLSTAGRLRTRTITSLAAASANGIGRNFLIQLYLGSGDYQLSLNTNGRSAGPLGLTLRRAPLREAGDIPLNGTVRTTIEPGEAVRYQLDIAKPGRYRLTALGLKQPFQVQLAGPDGWPVIAPGTPTPVNLDLRPGRHTLTVLPQGVAARAVTTVNRVDTAPARLQGHGPHQLPLNHTVHHTWMEPGSQDAPRTPDHWRFDLAAAMRVHLDLPTGMDATLLRREGGSWTSADQTAAATRAGWQRLEAGAYRLEVRSRRPNNRLDYQLRLASRELPVGQSRRITPPTEIPFALARSRLVKLSSLGGRDVAASLRNERGERIAFNDDRPDDWNFLVSRQLPPGRYTLAVTATGEGGGTTVSLEAPREVTEAAVTPAADVHIGDADVHVYPLTLPAASQIPDAGLPLVFVSRSAGTHGIALERRDGDGWQAVTTRNGRTIRGGMVLTADDVGRDHRLRVWALDTVPQGVQVALRLVARPNRTAGRRGRLHWRLAPIPDTEANLGLAVLDRPGPLHTDSRSEDLLWANPGGAFAPVREGWVPARDPAVWLLAPPALERLPAEIVSLTPGTARSIPATASHALPLRIAADNAGGLGLWTAQSPAFMPELYPAAPAATASATASARTAVAVALPGDTTARHGLSLGLVDAAAEAPVTVTAHTLTTGQSVAVESGNTQITVSAGKAIRVTGPAGSSTVELAAGARLAGILVDGGAIQRVLWTGDRARKLHTQANVETLWLANPGDQPETVSLAWESTAEPAQLTAGRFLGYRPAFSGTLSVPVSPPTGAESHVHVAGEVDAVRFVDARGHAHPPLPGAGSLAVTGPGVLQVDHADAAFGIWLAGADNVLTGWQRAEPLTPDGPVLLSLRDSQPTLIALERPDGQTMLHWLDDTGGIDTLLPAGTTRLRTMGAAPQRRLTEPAPMPAGLGKAIRLGPGEARAFTFTLEQRRTVGLGLKAERETIRSVLVDAGGRRLGEGIAQMHQLEPGRYYLIARLPGGEAPTRVQTALVGTERPDDGPPERVRERYRRLTGEE